MALKEHGETKITIVNRFGDGFSWIAYPHETMQRASQALRSGSDVFLIDPLDGEGLTDALSALGTVKGVVILFDRHTRDAISLANQYDVPIYLPEWMSGVGGKASTIVSVSDMIGSFTISKLYDTPFWQEAILYDGSTLVVPEAVGTASYFRTTRERLGVHPLLRLRPPKQLKSFDPERILVGHGSGLETEVQPALHRAIDGARSGAPRIYWNGAKQILLGH